MNGEHGVQRILLADASMFPNNPDMCYGKQGERPDAVRRIAMVPVPATDPLLGLTDGIVSLWKLR